MARRGCELRSGATATGVDLAQHGLSVDREMIPGQAKGCGLLTSFD